jgi:protein-S-isoprenylcysteine O-methyltransferase Ste14
MTALKISIGVLWVLFGAYWLVSAAGAKRGSSSRRSWAPRLIIVVLVLVLLRVFRPGSLSVDDPILEVVGTVLFLAGLGLAVWARVYLGSNWGMPMTRKDDPELVTSGPYHLVRHPIYSGILLAMLGTSLATTLYWLIALIVLGVYFIYSARVEERLMAETFPDTYPSYRASSKMLVPFLL